MATDQILGVRRPPYVSAEAAVQHIQSGDRIYLHEVAMTPHELLDALVLRTAMVRRHFSLPSA